MQIFHVHIFSLEKKKTILFKFFSLTSNNGYKYAKGERISSVAKWKKSICIRRGTWNWNWILWITNLPFLWRLFNNISAQKCSDNKDNFNGNQCFVFRWATKKRAKEERWVRRDGKKKIRMETNLCRSTDLKMQKQLYFSSLWHHIAVVVTAVLMMSNAWRMNWSDVHISLEMFSSLARWLDDLRERRHNSIKFGPKQTLWIFFYQNSWVKFTWNFFSNHLDIFLFQIINSPLTIPLSQ